MIYKRQQRPFQDRFLIGEYGENVVMDYFNSKNIKFDDKRHIKEFQADEIDFITYVNGKRQTVEVKTSEINMYKYNTIMVKLLTVYDDKAEAVKRGNDSYMYRTKASYLFYVCCKTKNIIVIKTDKLKEYLNANLSTLKVITYQDNEEDVTRSNYNRKNTVTYISIDDLFKKIPNGIKRIKTNYKLNFNDSKFSSKRQ